MIEKLQILNFQSHKKSELDFHPGVNTIIGSSDSGKTAILRALRWAIWNKPLGDAFRSNWGGDTEVAIHLKDGPVIERFKGKGGDKYYSLFDDDGNEFKAFGTTPPEEIQKYLNLSDINLQTQHDPHFLLSNNPGEVARYFNRIARIDQIDKGLQNVEKWVRKINNDITYNEEQITSLKSQIKSFDYIETFEKKLESIEKFEDQKNKKEQELDGLNDFIVESDKIDEEIEAISDIAPAEKQVDHLLSLYEEKEQIEKDKTQLSELIRDLKDTNEEIDERNHIVQAEKILIKTINLYNKRDEIKEQVRNLGSTITQFENVKVGIKSQEDTLEYLEETWHREWPSICPLCGAEQNKK